MTAAERAARAHRRKLVLELLAVDIEGGAIGRWDAYKVVTWVNRQELDDRAIRIIIARWQDRRAVTARRKTAAALGYSLDGEA